MTVKELKEILETLPDDATVYRQGDEYTGDIRNLKKVDYHLTAGFGIPDNAVIVK